MNSQIRSVSALVKPSSDGDEDDRGERDGDGLAGAERAGRVPGGRQPERDRERDRGAEQPERVGAGVGDAEIVGLAGRADGADRVEAGRRVQRPVEEQTTAATAIASAIAGAGRSRIATTSAANAPTASSAQEKNDATASATAPSSRRPTPAAEQQAGGGDRERREHRVGRGDPVEHRRRGEARAAAPRPGSAPPRGPPAGERVRERHRERADGDRRAPPCPWRVVDPERVQQDSVPGGWAEGWIGSVGESSAKRSRKSRTPSESSAGSAGRYSLAASGSRPKTEYQPSVPSRAPASASRATSADASTPIRKPPTPTRAAQQRHRRRRGQGDERQRDQRLAVDLRLAEGEERGERRAEDAAGRR